MLPLRQAHPGAAWGAVSEHERTGQWDKVPGRPPDGRMAPSGSCQGIGQPPEGR